MNKFLKMLNKIIVDTLTILSKNKGTTINENIETFEKLTNVFNYTFNVFMKRMKEEYGIENVTKINDIELQDYLLRLFEKHKFGEVEFEDIDKVNTLIRKHKLGPKPTKEVQLSFGTVRNKKGEIIKSYHRVDVVKLYDKDSVYRILVNNGLINKDKYGMMSINIEDSFMPRDVFAKEMINFVKTFKYKKTMRVVPIFPKSGASRMVVAKVPLNEKVNLTNIIYDFAKQINVDKWLDMKGITGKTISKIGVIMARQGTVLDIDKKIKFKIIDIPESDGVVAFFKKRFIYDMFKEFGINPSNGFQGTLFDHKLGMYAKGTFVEIDDFMFKTYESEDVDVIINKDTLIGNILTTDIETGTIDAKSLLILNNFADYKAKATFTRQLTEYHLNLDKIGKFTELLEQQAMRIVEKTGFADSTYARLIKFGIPTSCSLVYKDYIETVTQTLIAQLGNINMKPFKLGDTHIAIGVPNEVFKHMIEKTLLKNKPNIDITRTVIIPMDSVLANNRLPGEIIHNVVAFKNPVTPTSDCPTEYTVIVGYHVGAAVYMSVDAPHIKLSGHDFDGDNVVFIRGIKDMLCEYPKTLPPLVDIKLEEVGDRTIAKLAELYDLVATQAMSPIGAFESMAGRLYSSKFNKSLPLTFEYYQYKFDTICDNYLLKFIAQVQGWINAQKKVIDGLEDHDVYSDLLSDVFASFLSYRDIFKEIYKTNTTQDRIDTIKDIIKYIDSARELAVEYNAIHSPLIITIKNYFERIINFYEKKEIHYVEKFVVERFNVSMRKWVKEEVKVNVDTLLYAILERYGTPKMKQAVNIIARDKKYWNIFKNIGEIMKTTAKIYNDTKTIIKKSKLSDTKKEELNAALSHINNEFLIRTKVFIKSVVYTIAQELTEIIKPDSRDDIIFSVWLYTGQKLTHHAFLNAADEYVLEAIVDVYEQLKKENKIKKIKGVQDE